MTEAGKLIVRACVELSQGDEIEAWHDGRLVHRGKVTETVPTLALFWILDARTGTRKLLDMEVLEIVRCAGAAAPVTQRTEPTHG